MALVKRAAMPLLAILMAVLRMQVSLARVYQVGESAGWTIIGNVDYKQWSATKSFKVGDTIIFQYNPQFHNVMKVSHQMYKSCNSSAPLKTYTTGNDSITLSTRSHHFFICGAPGHCEAGQKVDINVPRVRSMASSPGPSAIADPPSSVPSASLLGPSPTNAASSNRLMGAFGRLGFAATVLTLMPII